MCWLPPPRLPVHPCWRRPHDPFYLVVGQYAELGSLSVGYLHSTDCFCGRIALQPRSCLQIMRYSWILHCLGVTVSGFHYLEHQKIARRKDFPFAPLCARYDYLERSLLPKLDIHADLRGFRRDDGWGWLSLGLWSCLDPDNAWFINGKVWGDDAQTKWERKRRKR